MSKRSRHLLLVVITSSLFIGQPAVAAEGTPGQLVSVPWLERNLQRDDVLVLDASPAKLHAAGHIPGAVNVDIFSFGGREVPVAEMERRIQSWGVSPGKKIVLYDQGGTYLATSLFFDLYYYGFPAEGLAILDGGLAKWQAAGGTVATDPTPAPKPGAFRIAKLNEDVRVRLPEFLVASGDPANNALVEALEPSQHFGGAKFFDRPGHIPNAILMPAADFYNADKTWKSAEEIRRMLAYQGIKPDQNVYAHCGGGIAASVPFFAARFVLDYPKVKLYKESQLEWLRDDRGLPFWTYDAPNLTREKTLAQRMGQSDAAQLRRREAERRRCPSGFGVQTVPRALRHQHPGRRIQEASRHARETGGSPGGGRRRRGVRSGDRFRRRIEPRFRRGVPPARKARTEEGLRPRGFAGRLGICRISAGQGGRHGRPQEGAAGPRQRAHDLPRQSSPGYRDQRFPRCSGALSEGLLASGKSLPAKVPDGKVVHVPYTELLNPNGTPKAASDIWNTLVKAGVPRYAEIISFSDDAGEAAANYFILKLMGYPDVKVLVL